MARTFRSAPTLLLITVLAGCAGPAGSAGSSGTGGAPGGAGGGGGRGDAAVPVSIAPVVEKTVPLEVTTIGSGEPETTVEVRSQVTGQLTSVQFAEGADVAKGQLLFTIDSRPFEA